MKNTFSVVFESDVAQVKRVVGEALRFLAGRFPGLSQDSVLETRLVLSETLINAVTHGNGRDINKKVSLNIEADADYSVTIQVMDEGGGFDYDAVIAGEASSVGRGELMEHGRGMRLIRSLSDNVSYDRAVNIIKIYKKVVTDE